jgi:hypothetical protein
MRHALHSIGGAPASNRENVGCLPKLSYTMTAGNNPAEAEGPTWECDGRSATQTASRPLSTPFEWETLCDHEIHRSCSGWLSC